MKAGMAHARRRGTLGNHAGHQRGEAADPMEPRPARTAAMSAPWVKRNVAAGALCLRNFAQSLRDSEFRWRPPGTVSPSFRVPAARGRRSAVHLGAVVGDVQTGHGAPLPSRPYRVATRLCVIEPDSASRNTTARPNRLSSLNLDCCFRIERLSVTQGWTVNEIPSTPGR